MTLPNDAKARESWPFYDYMYGYFPDAFMAEVEVSWVGNQQHNPGQKMHWAREKSTDHMNKAMRHIDDYGRGNKKDTDGCWHLAKAIWRLKARLQLDIEEARGANSPSAGGGTCVGSGQVGNIVPIGTIGTSDEEKKKDADLQRILDDYRKAEERRLHQARPISSAARSRIHELRPKRSAAV